MADLTNDELFTFHAVRAMLNELVRIPASHSPPAVSRIVWSRAMAQQVTDACMVWCDALQVQSMIACDVLVWGGDTRWLVALRIEGANQIQSVNGPIY